VLRLFPSIPLSPSSIYHRLPFRSSIGITTSDNIYIYNIPGCSFYRLSTYRPRLRECLATPHQSPQLFRNYCISHTPICTSMNIFGVIYIGWAYKQKTRKSCVGNPSATHRKLVSQVSASSAELQTVRSLEDSSRRGALPTCQTRHSCLEPKPCMRRQLLSCNTMIDGHLLMRCNRFLTWATRQ
jgi:hypothetical protein